MRRSASPDSLVITAPRGRPFAKGNPGRKPGSKNRSTLLAAALLEGHTEALLRTAIALALGGNALLLKFFADRTLPRERVITIDLPKMEFADDGVEALGAIMRAVSVGEITPDEGAKVATIIKSYTDAIDMADAVKRLDAIEDQIRGSTR